MPGSQPHASYVNGTVTKRRKTEPACHEDSSQLVRHSKIFAPFRTVGLVSPTNVPFTSLPLGKTTFQITTSVGRSLQTYDLKRGLNLVFITHPQTPADITATLAWKKVVFAAWHGGHVNTGGTLGGVWIFQRGKKIAELELPRGGIEKIRKLIIQGEWVIGCGKTRIEVWKSGSLEHYTTLQSATSSRLSGCLCTMPTYLNKAFAGRTDGTVEIWNLNTGKLLHTLLPPAADFGSVIALQPTPALSLLAIAYESGPVTIHDICTDKEIMCLNTGGNENSCITSISFRTDGLGAGSEGRDDGVMATASHYSGDITFWDLNDGGRKTGTLYGAHQLGSSLEGDVGRGTSKIEFLPGQAVLVSSGSDNSLKSWILDETPFSPIPRILHSRGGHARPVSSLQFLPTSSDGSEDIGKWLLSGSQDRSLWGWSLRRDGQSTELSQGAIQRKAKKMGLLHQSSNAKQHRSQQSLKPPPITCIACSLNRDGGIGAMPGVYEIWNNSSHVKGQATKQPEASMTGWESIITGHSGSNIARTWFWGRKRAGRWGFKTGDRSAVRSVAMSSCGTFALIGSAGGSIEMYNLQSGKHRRNFPPQETMAEAKKAKFECVLAEKDLLIDRDAGRKKSKKWGKHSKAVTGLAVDSLNRTLVSCGEDGRVKFWDFSTGVLNHEVDWYPMTKVLGLRYHRNSDLVALNCDDGSIRVLDITTRKLVRELWTSQYHAQTQTIDYTFSNDGRWIVSAGVDSIVKVWDLPTGHLIDAMRLPRKCTTLAFSPSGEYLATSLEGQLGVQMWTNRTLFTHVSTHQIKEKDVASVSAPNASGEGGVALVEAATEEQPEEDEDIEVTVPIMDQLSDKITTLSLVPKSRWQTLLHLDAIRARNKPKEAPKPLEKAPFFLPSLGQNGIQGREDATSTTTGLAPVSRISKSGQPSHYSTAVATSEFTKLLAQAVHTTNYSSLLSYLASLPPSSADIAIRTLDTAESSLEVGTFLDALLARLKQRKDYELVQAWMSVFLRIHGDIVIRDEMLVAKLRKWQEEAKKERERMNGLVGYSLGIVGWVRSAR